MSEALEDAVDITPEDIGATSVVAGEGAWDYRAEGCECGLCWDGGGERPECADLPRAIRTTIEQHIGTRPDGARTVQLHEVRTDAADWISLKEWASLTASQREDVRCYLAEIHAASLALAELDYDQRRKATDLISDAGAHDLEDMAGVIRRAIRAVL